jgi:hypothetical protein
MSASTPADGRPRPLVSASLAPLARPLIGGDDAHLRQLSLLYYLLSLLQGFSWRVFVLVFVTSVLVSQFGLAKINVLARFGAHRRRGDAIWSLVSSSVRSADAI